MASLTLRQSKDSPLTFAEVDGNFTALNNDIATRVPSTRTITAGNGLSGGGNLSANRTIELSEATVSSLENADSAVQPGRTITAGGGLTGGGDLSDDRTLEVDFSTNTTGAAGIAVDESINPAVLRHVLDTKPSGIPVTSTASGGRVLADADKGQIVPASSGGWTVPSTLSAGTAVTLLNASASSQTVTQGSGVTMYHSVDGATGNRTLAARGMATVVCRAAGECYIVGAGLE